MGVGFSDGKGADCYEEKGEGFGEGATAPLSNRGNFFEEVE